MRISASERALYPYPKLQKRFRKSRKKRIYPNGSTWAKERRNLHAGPYLDGLLETIDAGMQREKQFTSDVAHELLRTPISVVLMQCEDLLQGTIWMRKDGGRFRSFTGK